MEEVCNRENLVRAWKRVAACGSLKPAPDSRLRGAYPHLLCSSALPLLVVRSRRTLVEMPSIARPRANLPQPPCNQGLLTFANLLANG